MSPITTHVLDTSRGVPAVGVPVLLEHQQADGTFYIIGEEMTNADGPRHGSVAVELLSHLGRLSADLRDRNLLLRYRRFPGILSPGQHLVFGCGFGR